MSPRATPPNVIDHGGAITAVRADNPSALTLTGTQSYVIGCDPVVVLDPGPLDSAHLDRIDEVISGRTVKAVCLTHSHGDHTAAAAAAAERWGPLRASADTLARLELAGRPLADGEAIELDADLSLRALETPGHAADHLAFLLEPGRDLFTGDLVLGKGSSIIVHPDGSVAAYLTSLARLVSLRPARLLPGHGPVVTDALKRLEAYRVHRLERTKHIRRAVEGGSQTLDEIREAVYPDLPGSHHRAAEFSIRAYLAYLTDLGHDVPNIPD